MLLSRRSSLLSSLRSSPPPLSRISGCYVHSSTTDTLHRRAYHLLPNESEEAALLAARISSASSTGLPLNPATVAPKNKNGVINRGVLENGTNFFLVLVHYLDTDIAAENMLKVDPSDSSLEPKKKGSVRGRGGRGIGQGTGRGKATKKNNGRDASAKQGIIQRGNNGNFGQGGR